MTLLWLEDDGGEWALWLDRRRLGSFVRARKGELLPISSGIPLQLTVQAQVLLHFPFGLASSAYLDPKQI
jgi:hypothetical protein